MRRTGPMGEYVPTVALALGIASSASRPTFISRTRTHLEIWITVFNLASLVNLYHLAGDGSMDSAFLSVVSVYLGPEGRRRAMHRDRWRQLL